MESRAHINSFPGVSLREGWLTLPTRQDTAVPVFAGFSSRLLPGELVELTDHMQLEAEYSDKSILYWAVRHYFDNGGRRCFVLSLGPLPVFEDEVSEMLLSAMTNLEYWNAVVQQPDISLLALPDCVLLAEGGEDNWYAVWQFLLALAQQCQAHALLDPPASASNTLTCLDKVEEMNSECGSVYWPHLVTAYQRGQPEGRMYTNTGREGTVVLPASAAVAAVMAQTDVTHGIWSAPANVPLRQVIKPQHSPREGYGLFRNAEPSINLIRSFPLRGTRVWGCRTLASDVHFDWRQYVQSRRTLVYIQQSLKHLCHFSVFEPNSLVTWLKMKGLMMSWLHELWQVGGLMGNQEEQAYYVRVGEGETMTAADIMQGQLMVDVGVALHYPAEFVQLHLLFEVEHGQQEPLQASSSIRGLA